LLRTRRGRRRGRCGGNGYHEVTDNQVAGVTEGDLFKRTDKDVFYLNCKDDGANLELQTFTIAKELSQQAGSCTITPENGAYYAGNPEMYLSADGETVRSVRFDKETAYVCTAKYVTDPVFVFDLSDPQDITSKDTGDIPGFSIALRQFYGGTLLGIGYDEAFNLKIELYREEENGVNSVAVWISGEGQLEFSGNYKSYLIDADNGYIGLCVNEFSYTARKSTKRYILLKFDGENLTLINTVEFETTEVNYHHTRACIIDGYLYVLNGVEPKFIAVNG